MTGDDMPTSRRPPRVGQLLLVGLLFAVVAVFASVTDPEVSKVPVPSVEEGERGLGRPPSELVSPREVEPEEPSVWGGPVALIGTLLAGALLLLLLGLLARMVWREVRDRVKLRPPRSGDLDDVEAAQRRTAEVKAAVEAGLEELAVTGTDPRSAVIACWVRLEHAAAAAGVPRAPSDTPGDLVARMLAAHDVSEPILDRLAAVYRLARYAPHEVGEPMREEAQAALRRVHGELSRPRPAIPAQATTPEAES